MILRKTLSPLAIGVSLLLLPSPLFSQGLKKIHVNIPAISINNIIIFFAKEAKIYNKHNLDTEPVMMSDSNIASRALIADSVTISPITTPAVINAVLAGSDMVILAHTMPGVIQSLMVRPEIKRPEDLKGKTIGVTTFGSLGDFPVRYLARQKGFNPDKDFALLQIGADPERLISLRQGKIQAAMLSHSSFILAQHTKFN